MKPVPTTPGKRWIVILVVTLFAIAAVGNIVHEFVTNDPVHYFSARPHHLLLVAAIAIMGGFVALIFGRLSPHLKRITKLLTLGLVAGCVTVFTVYFVFAVARLWSLPGDFDGRSTLILVVILVPLCLGSVAVLLWLEFLQVFKNRVPTPQGPRY